MPGGMEAWKDAGFETELALQEPRRSAPHPGQVLAREYMAPKAMDLTALARKSGLAERALADLVAGLRAVDGEMSLRLARVFATEPGFWLLLQVAWDMERAEAALGDSLRATG